MSRWETVRAGVRVVGHRPEHAAAPDLRAERVAAAGTGLLVLVGAILTYLAVVGGIDPLLTRTPAGGAPPATVPGDTPERSGGADQVGAPEPPASEPTTPRPRPQPTTSPPVTAPPAPTPTSGPPSPTPSPDRRSGG